MKRHWPIIAVSDVPKSAVWYSQLLNARQSHPGGTVFDQLLDDDGTVLLCLHHWGPSGPRGDHHWPTLSRRSQPSGNGILLWFVVDDFGAAWDRAQNMGCPIRETPNADNGTGKRAFVVEDLDGHHVAINDAS